MKRDDAFISWLDGHECTIVYCMSLRVLIERNTNTKYANTKKLYSTRRIKKKVFFFIDWIIDLRCLNITGCDSRVRLNEITSSIHHMTGMKSHVDFGTARGCFIIIWACGKTLKKTEYNSRLLYIVYVITGLKHQILVLGLHVCFRTATSDSRWY